MFLRNICFIAFSLCQDILRFLLVDIISCKNVTLFGDQIQRKTLSLKEQIIFQRQDLLANFQTKWRLVFHDHSNIFLLSAEQSIACFPFLSCRLLYRNDQPIWHTFCCCLIFFNILRFIWIIYNVGILKELFLFFSLLLDKTGRG